MKHISSIREDSNKQSDSIGYIIFILVCTMMILGGIFIVKNNISRLNMDILNLHQSNNVSITVDDDHDIRIKNIYDMVKKESNAISLGNQVDYLTNKTIDGYGSIINFDYHDNIVEIILDAFSLESVIRLEIPVANEKEKTNILSKLEYNDTVKFTGTVYDIKYRYTHSVSGRIINLRRALGGDISNRIDSVNDILDSYASISIWVDNVEFK